MNLFNYNQFLLNESKVYTLNEGGAYGHLSHPFEDLNLSLSDISSMIHAAVNGSFGPENFIQEKTDGQQLSITWKSNSLRAARNKSHLKNSGQDSMSAADLSSLFAGRGNIEIAFTAALKDLTASISKLSDADKQKYFSEGKKFASVEIITPATQNTVPYGQNMLVFHGVIEYDESGNPIAEDKQAGRDLGKLIADANAAAQETFYVRGPQDISLLPLPNTKSREAYYLNKLNAIIKENGLSPSSTVEQYAIARASRLLVETFKQYKKDIPSEYIEALSKRMAGLDKSFTAPMIKKSIPDSAWYLEYEKNNEKSFRKQVFSPLEEIFLELGTEIMKNVTTFLSANPTAAAEAMKREINDVISKIKTTGSEEEVKKMEWELQRVAAAGGLESIVPTEGITFVYKGKLYKFTGIFAALHQIRSILAFKK